MKIFKSLLLFTSIITNNADCKDFLLALGAGGEGSKDDTIFDQSILNLSQYLKRNPQTKAELSINGNHPMTEFILKYNFSNETPQSKFTAENYKKILESYKIKLEKNEIKDGDQLMIYINSHGAKKGGQEKTHYIATINGATDDLKTLSGTELVNLDLLEEIKKIAKKKKVKLAIVDTSCFSGNTLALADENTCVISGTGSNHFSYTTFSENFIEALKKGTNLEDAFLSARALDKTPDLPSISTPEGQDVQNSLYELITPYLYYFDRRNDLLFPFLQENQDEISKCLFNLNFNSLMKSIEAIEDLNTKTERVLLWKRKVKELDLSELKDKLISYKNNIDIASRKISDLEKEYDLKKIDVIKGFENSPISRLDLLKTDYKYLIKSTNERIALTKDPIEKFTLDLNLQMYTKTDQYKEDIIKKSPGSQYIFTKIADLKESTLSNYQIARDIAEEERKLYQALYNKKKYEKRSTTKNACRNFTI